LKAIILAAGQGTRLKPITNTIPKCLTPLFGKTIIERQLEVFKKLNICDISIVVGYKKNKILYNNIHYYENKLYSSTNMVETLFCAREKLTNDVIVSYGDIVFEEKILKKLIDSTDDISVVIDNNWKNYWQKRFKNPLEDVESLTLDKNNFILDMGQKVSSLNVIQGQYIGLMKFQNNATSIIKNFYDNSKELSLKGNNPLNPNLPFNKSYMTDFLRGLIQKEIKIKGIKVNGGWLELDTIHDLELYEQMYENGELKNFFNIN
jgi:L-glutamine-phosphate cytidylyltransferase